jgi:ketosteroid isomerase-like protein
MSQENVEAVKEVYATLTTGDLSALLELCDPEVEITEPSEIPDSSTFRGHDGVRGVLEKLQQVFPDMLFLTDEFVGEGDQVLVSMRWVGTGVGSGASADVRLFHVWTFAEDRATRIDAFLNRKQALEAAGLAE